MRSFTNDISIQKYQRSEDQLKISASFQPFHTFFTSYVAGGPKKPKLLAAWG